MDWSDKRTIGQLSAYAASRFPESKALIFGERSWTWRAFEAEVDAAAKALIGAGVQTGEHVALWMTNRPEWLFLLYAIPRVGAILVPLNTRYRADDFAHTLDQSDASTLFLLDQSGPVNFAEILRENLPQLPKLQRVIQVGDSRQDNAINWEQFLAGGRDVPDDAVRLRAAAVNPEGLALIIYTSGTTSMPKGVMHSHVWLRLVDERARRMGLSSEDVFLSYLPLFHAYGFSENAIASALVGGCQVLTETFDADALLQLAEKHGATVLHGFATHFADLMHAQEARTYRLQLKKGTFCAGEPSVTPVAYAAQSRLCPTVSGWGQSETWAFATLSQPGDTPEQRCEASGQPFSGIELRIIDSVDGRDLATGQAGEILVRSYTRMLGYYKLPEQTAQVIDADGWIHSGDLGRRREDGHLVFIGRCKDMIKVGGENVAPAEIEQRLGEHPAVREVAVVGVPDPRLGEVAGAFVVLVDGQSPSVDALLALIKGRIASFKIPRHVWFVDALPKTPSGKVHKAELRARAARAVAAPPEGPQEVSK